ncbi:hypothetical protein [Sphaerisporangium aureirubrum]|uniref:Nuclear transport factor 2 family protein n=1 Tax=Sphaerisporangium aureirubrum TaxID=1544736 RepID=A0ABW1NJV1_9ACTN
MFDVKELVARYVAVWHEPDPELRRKAIAELWTEDGVHLLQPPKEIREAAAALGVTPVLRARGHEDLQTRVTRSYEEFVAPGEFRFRPRDDAARLGDAVKFTWEMVPTAGGPPAGVGVEVLLLAEDGRIHTDHQFVE